MSTSYVKNVEPMARGKICLVLGIHCCLFLFNSFYPTSVSTLCVGLIHELPLLRNNNAVKQLYSNRKRCQVLTGNLSHGCRPADDWANTWHWTIRFTITAINRRPQCSKDNHMSIPFPVLKSSCSALEKTTERLALDRSANTRTWLFYERTVPSDIYLHF